MVPTTYLVDTTLSDASDYDQTVHAVRLRTDGIIARAVDIPVAVAMQINERFQFPDSCVSRLLKLSKDMFRENRRRDDRHCVSP
ncbi:hypothetical protein D4M90_25220 [Klebsiella oxytoca]|nr:hypothetical protein D4M90_25220 [Klebsiella oxytoca]